ncbi:hypothetical protein BSU00_11675 [Tenacibaculum sp. SG-28]|nr:hypothetical protein BSU00_11675 [Tenacibaculum sp. SG-28]
MFYIPNLPYAFYLALKAKHVTFFTAANPGIKSAGNGTESKFETLQLIPKKYRPKSVLIQPKTAFEIVAKTIEKADIHYPIIAKPDIGFRGLLVQKLATPNELKAYLKKHPIAIIVQEFVSYENECGIFYTRQANQEKGIITSITLKKFLTVQGDGVSSIKELVQSDERARLYKDLIAENKEINLNSIPKKEAIIRLSVIGNHSKGTQFINGNKLISEKLQSTFDSINNTIKGWYYGRLDIKYHTFQELEAGEKIKILEINGIIAEPTHIYDSHNSSYFEALKAIRSHWRSLYNVSITNHKVLQTPYKNPLEFTKELLELKKYLSILKKLI